MFIDSHIHLSYHLFNQMFSYIALENDNFVVKERGTREQLIKEMKEQNIACVIEPAIDIDSNELLLNLSEKYPSYIYPAVGVHPTRTPNTCWKDREKVEAWAHKDNVVAVGETGLDYHLKRREQYRFKQKRWFLWQIKLADRLKLPLILHIRQADKDAIRILRKYKDMLHGGVCHCFGGGPEVARIYTEELGFCLGIGGTLLMNSDISKILEETVREISLEYLLLETDGPYVSPKHPEVENISGKKWRKARNTSLILPAVAKRIAEIKGISIEEVERVTSENAKRVFKI